jgi:hypothetical protein
MKKWRFSTDAIKEFIVFATKGSHSIALEQFYTNYHHYKENREIDDSIPYDVWRTRWYKTYPEMKETLEPKKATLESKKATLESEKATLESEYVGDFSRALFELSYGDASGESQAIILRAYLIKTLPLDILKQIGEENIMVAGYKGVNHAFVVVKRFYGKTDEPADCLVIDTYIADLYLRDIEHYRPEAAYPISHFYYSALLRNTNHKDLKRIMATEFPQQEVPNVHEKRKPYMGRMQGHFEFLHDYVEKPDVPNNLPAELKLVDRTFYYLENTVAYNNAYLLIEESQPFVYKRL